MDGVMLNKNNYRASGINDLPPAVIAFVLIAIVAAVGGLILANFQSNSTVLAFSQTVTPSAVANTMNETANTLTVTFSGAYSWVSVSHPITVSVTGYVVNTVATNTVYATPLSSLTKTYTLTSATGSVQSLSATGGNYVNITSVSLSGLIGGAEPQMTATVIENYLTVTQGSAPAAYTANSLTAVVVATGTASSAYNSIGYGLSSIQTMTSFLPLLALVIVAAAIIGVVVLAFKFGGGSSEKY
jgi:hypothetical protein